MAEGSPPIGVVKPDARSFRAITKKAQEVNLKRDKPQIEKPKWDTNVQATTNQPSQEAAAQSGERQPTTQSVQPARTESTNASPPAPPAEWNNPLGQPQSETSAPAVQTTEEASQTQQPESSQPANQATETTSATPAATTSETAQPAVENQAATPETRSTLTPAEAETSDMAAEEQTSVDTISETLSENIDSHRKLMLKLFASGRKASNFIQKEGATITDDLDKKMTGKSIEEWSAADKSNYVLGIDLRVLALNEKYYTYARQFGGESVQAKACQKRLEELHAKRDRFATLGSDGKINRPTNEVEELLGAFGVDFEGDRGNKKFIALRQAEQIIANAIDGSNREVFLAQLQKKGFDKSAIADFNKFLDKTGTQKKKDILTGFMRKGVNILGLMLILSAYMGSKASKGQGAG